LNFINNLFCVLAQHNISRLIIKAGSIIKNPPSTATISKNTPSTEMNIRQLNLSDILPKIRQSEIIVQQPRWVGTSNAVAHRACDRIGRSMYGDSVRLYDMDKSDSYEVWCGDGGHEYSINISRDDICKNGRGSHTFFLNKDQTRRPGCYTN
jgi:hypothetical protein